MSDDPGDAWGAFWAQQPGGCLPQGQGSIGAIQEAVWRRFAAILPLGARVLDLATGDGRVMGWMHGERADLELEGIDLAPALPPPPAGTRSRGGVAMEALPFADRVFEAVVSQFGFEYGQVAQAAAELARVLKPGGTVGLMLHRLDGPVVAHNRQRRSEIRWATERYDIIGIVRSALGQAEGGHSQLPSTLAYALQESVQRFGRTSPAWEISEAARRILAQGPRRPPEELHAALDRLEEGARGEVARIDALERAAMVGADQASLDAIFAALSLKSRSAALLRESDAIPPFAEMRILQLEV